MDDLRRKYPPNSHKKKEEELPKKEIKQIVQGKVTRKKRNYTQKFTENFLGDDVANVKNYIFHEVIVPAVKNAISDLTSGGVDMLLFGETRGRRSGGRNKNSNYNYTGHSRRDREDRPERNKTMNRRAVHNFDDIVLDTRGEAEEVLSNLVDLVVDYGFASVADLYAMIGIAGNYTDRNYGWSDLDTAEVRAVRDGYLIRLPRTRLLD